MGMIIDKRVKWVERFKRDLNHYHNGIKNTGVNEKIKSYIGNTNKADRIKKEPVLLVSWISKKYKLDFKSILKLAEIIGINWFDDRVIDDRRRKYIRERDMPQLEKYIQYYKSL